MEGEQKINKHFVPKELCVLLKKLNFNETTIATWENNKINLSEFLNSLDYELCEKSNVFPAYTWEQAFDFFRDEKNLTGDVLLSPIIPRPRWVFCIETITHEDVFIHSEDFINEPKFFPNHYLAKKECLKKMIELINKEE